MALGNCLLLLCTVWPLVLTAARDPTRIYNNSDLGSVALFIVREHISRQTTTLVVAENGPTPDATHVNSRVLHHLLQNLDDEISVQLYIGNEERQLWEYYVFIVDSIAAFRALQWKFPHTYYDRRFHFLIILTKVMPNLLAVIRKIFTICYMFHVINVALLVEDPLQGVCLYTYKLFTEDKCQVVQPVIQYMFNQGFSNFTATFNKKLINLYGCPLRVILRVIPPQIIFSGDYRDADAVDRLSGIEGEVLKLIAKTMNFRIKFMPFLNDTYSPNYFVELLRNNADVAVGAFSASDPHRWVTSTSIQYHQSPYIYVVRVCHLLESFDRLLRPFSPNVWWLVGLLLVGGTVIIYVLLAMRPVVTRFVFGHRNATPLGNFFAAFLGYPIARMPRRNFARFVLFMWLSVSFVIRSAYQTALYDAIRQDKFTKMPSGYDDLIKWNFSILVSRDINDLDVFPKNNTVEIVSGNHTSRIEMLKERSDRVAVVLLLDSYLHYINTGYNFDIYVQVVPEVIYMYQMVMYFPKHSIFMAPFNKKLQSLASSGIIQAICSRFYSEPGLFKRRMEKSAPKTLTNERLIALYTLCSWCLLPAGIVFVLEVLSKCSARVRTVVDWMQ